MERELRERLFQIYIREMTTVFLQQESSSMAHVARHVELIQELDLTFRAATNTGNRAKRELKLLHNQFQLIFETMRLWVLPDSEITSQVNTLIRRRQHLTQRYQQMQSDIKNLGVIVSQFFIKARTLHGECMKLLETTFQHYLETTQIYQETAKRVKNTKTRCSSWLKNIAIVIGIILIGYTFSLSPWNPHTSIPSVSSFSGTSITSSKLPVIARVSSQGVASSISLPLPSSISIVSSVPDHITVHAMIPNVIRFLPPSVQPIPMRSTCTFAGYWNAIVEGFTKDDEITRLAFEMGNNLIDKMESRADELAGMLGAWGAARTHNIYQSVRDYHKSCR